MGKQWQTLFWGAPKSLQMVTAAMKLKDSPPLKESYDQCSCCCWCIASVASDSVRPHRQQPTRLSRPWDSPGKNTGVGCHFLLQWMKVKSESEVIQSCPTLIDPMDCSPPGSSIHGIFQAEYWNGVPLPSPDICYGTLFGHLQRSGWTYRTVRQSVVS